VVFYWSIYITLLELILSKIRKKTSPAPAKAGAGQKQNPKICSRAKNFLP